MFILQHIWSRWTKQSRGANAERPRPRLPEGALLPQGHSGPVPLLHSLRLLEAEDFRLVETVGPLTPETWRHSDVQHAANLSWKTGQEDVEVTLTEPWPSLRRTIWKGPPSGPIARVREGQRLLILWNARFFASAAGSDRSYFFEEHALRIANLANPSRDALVGRDGMRVIDLLTRIY
ncbi:MAG: hypothetical protein KGS00_10595 [Alphaproteobacteria bacterium]|nr:hypothetical protein [Alphaproteobacteria bacterium]